MPSSSSSTKAPSAVGRRASQTWECRYVEILRASDLVVIAVSVVAAQFGWVANSVVSGSGASWTHLDYSTVSLVVVAGWFALLGVAESRDRRIVGSGADEYKRVLNGSAWAFGALAVVSYLLKLDISRGYFLTSLPAGVAGLLLSRWGWRQWLRGQRNRGRFLHRAVVVGSPTHAKVIVDKLLADPGAGYLVVGVCLDRVGGDTTFSPSTVPVLGSVEDVLPVMNRGVADTLIVTAGRSLTPKRLRAISWGLEPSHRHLLMASGLVDVAGPRLATRPVAGVPLMHVETPRFSGGGRVVKCAFDYVSAALALIILSPLMVLIAGIVKSSSPGPVFYKQERIGENGKSFKIWKFRTMRVGADAELNALLKAQGTDTKPLFKVENDPRITSVGGVLRKYSLDELPQFFNVLSGSMSIVGPRPQIPAEVALYDDAASRRLLVKPGITGLWQVSGRSDLSWEDTVRLDLYYVENWSLTADLQILWRTVKVVFARQGAY